MFMTSLLLLKSFQQSLYLLKSLSLSLSGRELKSFFEFLSTMENTTLDGVKALYLYPCSSSMMEELSFHDVTDTGINRNRSFSISLYTSCHHVVIIASAKMC